MLYFLGLGGLFKKGREVADEIETLQKFLV
jgi:hypothetical protein